MIKGPVKTIIYTCPFVPPEWIKAHGLIPSRITPDPDGGKLITAAEGICSFLSKFLNQTIQSIKKNAVIFTTVCDQMRRAPEYFDLDCQNHVFLMNVPSTWLSPESQELYLSEIKRLGNFLVDLGGKTPTKKALSKIMLEYEKKRNTLRSAKNLVDQKIFSGAIAEFFKKGEVTLGSVDPNFRPYGIPVALVGGPLTTRDFSLFDIIKNYGGYVALNGTETGERTFPRNFNPQRIYKDPIQELASAYFDFIPDAFRRPNYELYKWLEKEIQNYEIKGLLLIRNVWCDIWHGEMQRMKELLNIPLLEIESNGENLTTRNSTRIQAFLETIS